MLSPLIRRTIVIAVAVSTLMVVALPATAAPRWHTLLETALKESAKTEKPILIYVNGSDWCPYCVKMKKNVFNQPEFADWAEDNVVLFDCDLPRRKRQSADVTAQNEELKRKYGAPHYPFVVFINAKEEKLGGIGYGGQDAAQWTSMAQSIVNKGLPADRLIWHRSIEDAKKTAEKDGKLLFAFFNGSDHSVAAQKLESDIFGQDAFKDWARENLALAEIDLKRTGISREERVTHAELRKEHNITRIPTAIVFDQEGKELVRVEGFKPGQAFDEWARPLIAPVAENKPKSAAGGAVVEGKSKAFTHDDLKEFVKEIDPSLEWTLGEDETGFMETSQSTSDLMAELRIDFAKKAGQGSPRFVTRIIMLKNDRDEAFNFWVQHYLNGVFDKMITDRPDAAATLKQLEEVEADANGRRTLKFRTDHHEVILSTTTGTAPLVRTITFEMRLIPDAE